MRTPVQQAAKAKGKQGSLEEDIPISYHGVAYVNMAPLLYPGVKRSLRILVNVLQRKYTLFQNGGKYSTFLSHC